ncbi:copper chaperone PCu(A)C [Jatrophihabitans sp. YIM 134969]
MPTDHRVLLRIAAAGAVTAAALTLAACGGTSEASTPAPTSPAASSSESAPPTAPVLARVGDLRIAAGFVPAPASPDVAAAYFTVVNAGAAADTLVEASSDASPTTTMHRTEGGSMVAIDSFDIPAGGARAFSPGADHLMLEGLTRTLVRGDRVTLTLDFRHAGTVTVTLPVTGYPTGGGLPTDALTPLPTESPLPSTTVAP